MEKRTFSRAEALEILKDLYKDYPEDMDNFDSYSNELLEAELCLSGVIHDEDMGGVV